MSILNKKQKGLLIILSLLAGMNFFIGEANAYIQGTVSVSPNPAQINNDVNITISASDPGGNILTIGYTVVRVDGYAFDNPSSDTDYSCADEYGNGASNCSHTFTTRFSENKDYSISGFAVEVDGGIADSNPNAFGNFNKIILTIGTVTQGKKPPTISNLSPATAQLGSILEITGTNFCPKQNNFEFSLNGVRFNQSSISGGIDTTVTPLAEPDSSCNLIRVRIPTNLIADNNAKVSVKNTDGESSTLDLSLTPTPEEEDNNGTGYDGPESYINNSGLELNWPTSPGGTKLNESSKLPDLIEYIYEWGIALGGLGVFVSLLIAGIQYLTSFGNPTSMKDAMGRIQSAIIGLILLLSSWLILNTINPDLTNFDISFNLPPPNIKNLDASSWKLKVIPCDRVEITHTTGMVKIGMGHENRTEFIVGSIISSQGIVNEKPNNQCMGQLKFYKKACGDEIATLGVTNNNITVDDDQVVKCIKFERVSETILF